MTARLIVLALVATVCFGQTGYAHNDNEHGNSATRHRFFVKGEITAEVPDFVPVGQHGCKVLLFHPGFHHTSGTLEGSFVEDGYFLLDRCTGEGFYYVNAVFTGTVNGSKPGVAIFRAEGRLRESTIIDLGHFTVTEGTGGLEGVNAEGTFNFTMGVGGKYIGVGSFERKKK